MKKYSLFLCLLCIAFVSNAQTTSADQSSRWFSDFQTGPYLFVDDIFYKSAMLSGGGLGHEFKNNIAVKAEYVFGHQDDSLGAHGLTHFASAQAMYFFKDKNERFRPYIMLGGGFLEFKNFTEDQYGFGWFLGAGIESKFHEKVQGFIEPRYLNTGAFDLEGAHQLVIQIGVRVSY